MASGCVNHILGLLIVALAFVGTVSLGLMFHMPDHLHTTSAFPQPPRMKSGAGMKKAAADSARSSPFWPARS